MLYGSAFEQWAIFLGVFGLSFDLGWHLLFFFLFMHVLLRLSLCIGLKDRLSLQLYIHFTGSLYARITWSIISHHYILAFIACNYLTARARRLNSGVARCRLGCATSEFLFLWHSHNARTHSPLSPSSLMSTALSTFVPYLIANIN